jgi:eukaryotic-like serine/threonine-protein kinase
MLREVLREVQSPISSGESPNNAEGAPGNARSEAGRQRTVVGTPSSAVRGQKFGNYELLEKIGQGGMGVVYKARQINLDRIVALKLLPFGQFSREDVVQRFHTEATAAAALQHPNIVAIHDVGEQDGQHYFSMDFVTGQTLAEVVREKPLPAKRAAGYLKTIADAVHYAHQHGILHRDLKPSNILIDESDQPRITDFGLAKRLTVDSDMTLTGQVLGSPNFMAPEQAEGRLQAIGPATEVYSLGALLYHLLTRQPPFQADTLTTLLKQVVETEPVAPRLLNPSVPRDLETICLKCLEKDAQRRYRTAHALAEDLGRFLADEPVLARPVGTIGKAGRWCRRQPVRAGLSAALGLVVFFGAAGVLWQWHRARQIAQAEVQQRERSQASEYAGDMLLAQHALETDNFTLAMSLLNKHRPAGKVVSGKQRSETDLRGWEWRYLWQFCGGDEAFTLHKYAEPVRALAASRNGRILAVSAGDRLDLWDLDARRTLSELALTTTEAVVFSPVAELLAVGTLSTPGNAALELWDISAGKRLRSYQRRAEISSVAFSPDGNLLASFDKGGNIEVRELATDRTFTNLTVAPPRFKSGVVVFSPDARRLAIGEDLGRIRLLDLRTGAFSSLEVPPGFGVITVTFSPDSKFLAAGFASSIGTICLWDGRTGEPRGQLTNHTDSACALVFSPDSRQLASVSLDGSLRLWNLPALSQVRCLRTWSGTPTALVMQPDGRTLITGGSGGSVCFWDAFASNREPTHAWTRISFGIGSAADLEAPSYAPGALDPRVVRRSGFAFAPDSRTFITPEYSGSLVLWDARSLRITTNLPALGSNHWCVASSPDGRWLAVANASETITVWDWAARRAVTNVAFPFEWFGNLGFSHSGSYLLASMHHNDYSVSAGIWRTGTWEAVTLTGSQFRGLWSLALSSDDRFLGTGYVNGAVKVFRFPSLQLHITFTNHNGAVRGVHFSPDGRRLISTSFDGSARIWDLASRRELAALRGHFHNIMGSALTPDGRRLATGGISTREAVKLWDLAAHRELLSLPGEGLYFHDLTFSPDGNILAATSLGGVAHFWRAPSWEEIAAAEKGPEAP